MDESVSLRRRLSSVESSSEYNMTKDGSDDGPLSSDSGTESNRSSDLTASTGLSTIIKVLSDSLLRTELAEMEMMKAREAARWEAEKRRMEMEVELTRMVLQTHLQVTTSLLVEEQEICTSQRKRKRSEVIEDESSTTREKSLALLRLLQLNLIFSNSLT
ncbi:hypothetical protein Bca4012_087671 [Brassica carinata]|uniref:GTD-binding domain-containing protein n=3 Tax=Brassica TaxID=3705 RepID=A0A0D3A535_BRAOL|nr:PREDICTED: uncharacterized protein At4g22160 isoform X2 [Brassica oleracea var. oleracea]XP_013734015.1 uncharacterized protein At4g22160 [Brassica napus]CAF2070550.1 unnamed protein product [Brassica napus]VDD49196.1 unnamed protein product [Brassica oleracea]